MIPSRTQLHTLKKKLHKKIKINLNMKIYNSVKPTPPPWKNSTFLLFLFYALNLNSERIFLLLNARVDDTLKWLDYDLEAAIITIVTRSSKHEARAYMLDLNTYKRHTTTLNL